MYETISEMVCQREKKTKVFIKHCESIENSLNTPPSAKQMELFQVLRIWSMFLYVWNFDEIS